MIFNWMIPGTNAVWFFLSWGRRIPSMSKSDEHHYAGSTVQVSKRKHQSPFIQQWLDKKGKRKPRRSKPMRSSKQVCPFSVARSLRLSADSPSQKGCYFLLSYTSMLCKVWFGHGIQWGRVWWGQKRSLALAHHCTPTWCYVRGGVGWDGVNSVPWPLHTYMMLH